MWHQVFIQDRPLIFVPVYKADILPGKHAFEIVSAEDMSIEKAIGRLEKKYAQGIYYLCNQPDPCWKECVSYFTLIEASGGLVENDKEEYLMIFRKGKWDMPKGKVEYDESPDAAATREVEEECGIDELLITEKLKPTFHTYTEKGKKLLKKTNWYLMTTSATQKPVPQTEEDISEVIWMTKEMIVQKVMPNTYASIAGLLSEFFDLNS